MCIPKSTGPKAVEQLSDRDEPMDAALSTGINVFGIAGDAASDIPVLSLGPAFSALDALLRKIRDMKSNDQEAQETVHNLESLRVVLENSTSRILDRTRSIDDVQRQRILRRDSTSDELRVRISQLSEELGALSKLAEKLPKKRRLRRFLFTEQHAELLQKINRRVAEAKDRFQVQRGINIEWILGEMRAQMEREEHERLLSLHSDILEKLNPADASYRSAATGEKALLHPETRKEILNELHGWATGNNPTKRIYVVHGPAGIGKSSVAHAFAKSIDGSQLGASFFFDHRSEECRDPQRVIPTLAYQIAHYNPDAIRKIVEAVRQHLPGGRNQALEHQVRELLKDPLSRLAASTASTILVLDGVDECSNNAGLVPIFLKLLYQAVRDIPSIRVLIVTRPETHIMDALESVPFQEDITFRDLALVAAAEDISLYIGEHLHEKQLSRFLEANPDAVERLTALAGGLFIYAATVVRCLEQQPKFAQEIYNDIVSSGGNISGASTEVDRLAHLYSAILQNAFALDFSHPERMDGICRVLAWIGGLGSYLRASRLEDEGIPAQITLHVVDRLRSVLKVQGDLTYPGTSFKAYHLSFEQFLVDPARCTDLPVSKALGIIAIENIHKLTSDCRECLESWVDPSSGDGAYLKMRSRSKFPMESVKDETEGGSANCSFQQVIVSTYGPTQL